VAKTYRGRPSTFASTEHRLIDSRRIGRYERSSGMLLEAD
jgi:hypothetical protein